MTEMSRRINGERIVLLGWPRAILLQLAHPLVAAGVADHSTLGSRPASALSRLQHTVRAMLAIAFGDARAHERALSGIAAIHRRVHGRLRVPVGTFDAGTPYSAEDPALLLWVHATLVESVVLAYEQFVHPLSDQERDAYCREAAPVAVALGADGQAVPASWGALRAYLDSVYASGVVAIGPDAERLAGIVLSPPIGWGAGPVLWCVRAITVAWLPGDVRQAYRFAWSPADARRAERVIGVVSALRRAAPVQLARWRGARRVR